MDEKPLPASVSLSCFSYLEDRFYAGRFARRFILPSGQARPTRVGHVRPFGTAGASWKRTRFASVTRALRSVKGLAVQPRAHRR